VPESVSAATDLDLISYLKAIPDARMRRCVRIPAWYLLLVVADVLSRSIQPPPGPPVQSTVAMWRIRSMHLQL
jgi:hypothetical protein